MADPRALRNKRLENEYKELMRINGDVINIVPMGKPPYEKYMVTFNIRTIVDAGPVYRNQTVCTLTIPPNYPESAPSIVANSRPYPWHINWYRSGHWCHGIWKREESLVNFLHRCARTLQFDPEITNPASVANSSALPFWNEYKRKEAVIPCDRKVLPILDTQKLIVINKHSSPRITIQNSAKPKISIITKN